MKKQDLKYVRYAFNLKNGIAILVLVMASMYADAIYGQTLTVSNTQYDIAGATLRDAATGYAEGYEAGQTGLVRITGSNFRVRYDNAGHHGTEGRVEVDFDISESYNFISGVNYATPRTGSRDPFLGLTQYQLFVLEVGSPSISLNVSNDTPGTGVNVNLFTSVPNQRYVAWGIGFPADGTGTIYYWEELIIN